MELLLKHTIEEVNLILQALSQRPFAEVADLINKIKANAMGQLTPAPADPELADTPESLPEEAAQ